MDLTSPTAIKEILEKYEVKPSKSLGQNFLIDKNILNKIILAGNLTKEDVVLEVGPGVGTLTCELAKSAGKVIAIEKDHDMINILAETLKDFNNVHIIEGDALSLNPIPYTLDHKYKLIANIPYYLTSHLIRTFLEAENPPQEIVLLIQKEVAQRICAKPPEMSLLAVSVQFYAQAKIISYVSKNCFLPAPKVDSAIIRITPHKNDRLPMSIGFTPKEFFKIVKAGFSHPRKQLANNFCQALKVEREVVESWLSKCGLKPNQRAETLSVDDWKNLASYDLSLALPEGKGVTTSPSCWEGSRMGSEGWVNETKGSDIPGYFTTDAKTWKLLQEEAVKMRKNPTKAEEILWKYLKANKNYHFRRQQIIDKFIVDFVCLSKKIIIEVDGNIHNLQKQRDEGRTKILENLGFRVLRFKNEEVIDNVDIVVRKIINTTQP
jgi:16S rRNA (adenine1518-N6/adenine1519-N6)-dimethyltransferase